VTKPSCTVIRGYGTGYKSDICPGHPAQGLSRTRKYCAQGTHGRIKIGGIIDVGQNRLRTERGFHKSIDLTLNQFHHVWNTVVRTVDSTEREGNTIIGPRSCNLREAIRNILNLRHREGGTVKRLTRLSRVGHDERTSGKRLERNPVGSTTNICSGNPSRQGSRIVIVVSNRTHTHVIDASSLGSEVDERITRVDRIRLLIDIIGRVRRIEIIGCDVVVTDGDQFTRLIFESLWNSCFIENTHRRVRTIGRSINIGNESITYIQIDPIEINVTFGLQIAGTSIVAQSGENGVRSSMATADSCFHCPIDEIIGFKVDQTETGCGVRTIKTVLFIALREL